MLVNYQNKKEDILIEVQENKLKHENASSHY